MTRNGRTTPFPNEFMTPPTWSSHTWRGSCGSNARSQRIRRGYSRPHARPVVDDEARAEPEGGDLRVPVLRRDAARDERARADRPRGRRVEAAPRAHGVRRRGAAARRAHDGGRVALAAALRAAATSSADGISSISAATPRAAAV